jgi:ribonuclease BN (tRNA processing enzyme)
VEAEGYRLLLDFGTGSLGELQRSVGLHALDGIVLSHLHPDHVFDAASYLVVRRYDPAAPFPPLPVWAPPGAAERLAAAHHPAGPPVVGDVSDVYDVRVLRPGRFIAGPFEVTVARMNHPVETYGVRVEYAGRVLAYSADTGPCDALVELSAAADLLLCEASYLEGPDNPPNLHMTGRQAGEHAAKAGVGRLVLTHLVAAWGDAAATLAEAASAFPGPIELAATGTSYTL